MSSVEVIPHVSEVPRATLLPDGPPPRRWTGEKGQLRDDATRESRWGLAVAAVFFIGFLGWAAFARLDSAVYGQGSIVVSGSRQAVQHREGGIVQTLDVREGQSVRQGQILMTLAASEAEANERAASGQSIGARAIRARLTAEMSGASTISFPSEFGAMTGADRVDADEAVALQTREFNARRAALETQRAVLRQDRQQLAQQVAGLQVQISSGEEQLRLIRDELAGVQRLADQGLVPLTRLRSLQRAAAQLEGGIGQSQADVARAREAQGQVDLRLASLDRDRMAEIAGQLREVDGRLAEVEPRRTAYEGQLQRTAVRAPVTGRVVGLTVFNVNAVVAAGQTVAEVVPERDTLVVESRVSPLDADDVRPGQRTEIRIAAFPGRELPIIYGTVIDISADAFTEERSGAQYFKVRVEVPQDQLAIIRRYQGAGALRPGLPAEVVIPLRRRTALEYMTEPFTRSLWRSFREQ